MSFLDDIGNFLRQRIANPVGADLSHLGTAVHNITGDIGNTIQHPSNFVQNQFPAFMQSHVPGFEAASEALYGKPGKINPTQGPGQVAMNWKGGAINNLNPTAEDVLQQGAQGAYHVNPLSFFDKNLSNTLGINTNQNARTGAGTTANWIGTAVGSLPAFLGGSGVAEEGLNALKETPLVGRLVTKAPLLSKIGEGVIANMAGGATQAASTPQKDLGTYAKNIGIQGLSSAPFGIGGKFANPFLRVAQGGLQGLSSVGIMDLLSGGKINPQDLMQAGVPAALALLGGKGNDEAALKAYLDQHPEVIDKLQNHPAVKAMTTLAKDNRGSINPGAFLGDQPIRDGKITLRGKPMTINDATLHGDMNPPEPPKGTSEQTTTGANQEPGVGELLQTNPFEKGKIRLGNDISTNKKLENSDKAFITAQAGGRVNEFNEFGNNLKDKIKKILPDLADQNAAIYGHERNMISQEELNQFLDGSHPEYKKYYQELISRGDNPVTAEEKVQQAVDTMNRLLPLIERGRTRSPAIQKAITYLQKAGFEPALEHAHNTGLLPQDVGIKDYLPNFVSLSEEERNLPNSSGITDTFSNAMKRTRNNIFENIAHGEIPHTNLPDMVSRYFNGYGKATAFRELESELSRTKGAGWIPLQSLDKNNWSQLGDQHYDQTKVMTNPATGKLENVTERYIFAGPKEAIDPINKAFSSTATDTSTLSGKFTKGYDTAVQALRYQQLSDSIYHIHNIGTAAVYERFKGNPLTTLKYFRDSFTPEQRQEAARWGYLKHTQDYRRMDANQKAAIDPKGVEASVGKILSKPGQAYTKVADAISSLIFDHIQEPAAMIAYAKDKDAFIKDYQKKNNGQMPSQVELDKHMLQMGKAAAGLLGEYQQEIRGASKQLQKKVFGRILISPNYTRSKVGLIKDASIGESIGGFKGAGSNEVRKGLLAQAVMGTIGTTLMSLAISGKLASPSKYNITAPLTMVNFGVGSDGKERQGNIFWGGALGDIIGALNNANNSGPIGGVLQEANNKLIPALGDIQDIMNNKDYLGKSITTPGAPLSQQLGEEAKYVAGPQGGLWPVPFTATNLISQINTNSNPSSTKKYSPGEIGYTALTGQTLSHVTPSNGSNGDLNGFSAQFNQTTAGKQYGDTQAAAMANNNKNYTPYIKGVAEVFKDGNGKTIPSFADRLAGYMNYNGGFNGGSKNTRDTAIKLQQAYIKTGNWNDALKSIGAQNINGIISYRIPPSTALNSSVQQYYTNTLYNPDYVNTAISGLAGIKPDQFGSLVQQFIVPDSSNPSKVNVSATEAKLKQYADSGAIGDWGPIMDQKINTSMGQYAAQNGFKFNDQTSGMDLIKKQIRAETSYDPVNAGMIDQIISHDIGAYEQYGNWQDAITSLRFDPSTNQGKSYFNEIASSSSVSTSTDKQNWLTLQLQRSDTTAYVPTAQRMGLSPLNTSSNKQGSSQGVDQQVVTANAQPQTQKSQFDNISSSVPYADLINTAATKYGVPASVIAAVIQQESGFNPNAVGDNGTSFGLRQYNMPSHPNLTPAQAEDPAFAIDTLARDIGSNISAAGGNWALAATNAQNPADHASYYSDINSLMGQFGGGTFAGNASGGSGGVDLASMLNGGMSLGDALNSINTTATTGLGGITNKQLASDTNKYFAAQTKLEKPNMFKLKGTTKATGLQANSGLASGVNTKQAKFSKIKLPSGKTIAVKGGLAKLSTSELKKVLAQAKKDLNAPHYKIYLRTNPLKLSEQTVRQ